MSRDTDPAAELPSDWWTASDCAAFLGITRSTWAAYVSRGQAPESERMFGRSPVWRPETVKEWASKRPRTPSR
jgi:predicted DNA-binding transcriptional regulator AlpA